MRSKYQTPKTFTEWQEWASAIRALADRVDRAAQDRGWAIAAEVGIPRCGCCLHNGLFIAQTLSRRSPKLLRFLSIVILLTKNHKRKVWVTIPQRIINRAVGFKPMSSTIFGYLPL